MFRTSVIDATIKKLKAQLANLLTMINLFLGGFSIIYTLQGELNISVFFIFMAALLDRFDGIVARKLKTESDLGKQLDSMSDIISFGVAPALLLYEGIIHGFATPGIFFTIFYIGCGAFRLARFNISESNGYFTGLPITAAGCILTLMYLMNPIIPPQLYMFFLVILSFLMVSQFTIKKI
ncbi:CDP-diacylglycerol--serine O-phosphatidyltransferase [Caldibacillus lycopersici]|uniref:CDP-diacylglycerol--serine O-phosphatidyltransferase n=1 Tax=Perspicuibacillus lycopersici TaxID=1325689 RepID=A0AAE3ISU7_9BACI|nr:CDP-diacylglycerol--serine O-phosphatidyltransferase [Perspicuibacillus lycopersici]MCU9613955.1 CDP-diacylglycerol--serine O-phosphatidyltransferase [Perspicuibacillus lycopersici]